MTTVVASRTIGILQVLRTSDSWTITPVIYNSGITYMPKQFTAVEAIDLFGACRLPKATLAQESFIVEIDHEISSAMLKQFGFEIVVKA
jgi:hypothetical protein